MAGHGGAAGPPPSMAARLQGHGGTGFRATSPRDGISIKPEKAQAGAKKTWVRELDGFMAPSKCSGNCPEGRKGKVPNAEEKN